MKRTLLSTGSSGERSCTASAPEGSAPQLRGVQLHRADSKMFGAAAARCT